MESVAKTGPALLRDLYELPEPIVSVYFRMEDPAGDDVALRRRMIRHQLQRAATGTAASRAVENALGKIPRGAGAVAAFVGRDGSERRFELRGADLVDRVSRMAVPDVTPFMRWQQYRPPYVLAALEGAGVELPTVPDGHNPKVSKASLDQTIRAMVDVHLREAVKNVIEQSGPGGLGVQGISAVIGALTLGQIRELLISPVADTTVWFGPGPTDLAEDRSGLVVTAADKRYGPVADVLIRTAALTGAEVWILPFELSRDLRQGVGGICRCED